MIIISLTDDNTGQAVNSWLHFSRRVPESVHCLLEIRIRGMASKGLEEDSLTATCNLNILGLSSKLF